MAYDIIFGSNSLVECEGLVRVVRANSDEESIIFNEDGNGNVVLNCTIKDMNGDVIVQVNNGNIVKLDDKYYLKENGSITIIDKDSEFVILDFENLEFNRYKLNGIFFISGREVIATDESLLVSGSVISNNLYRSPTQFLSIHPDGSISM